MEQDRRPNGQFGPSSAPEVEPQMVDMGGRRGAEIVDWSRVRPSDEGIVRADLDLRLRHADGVSMTLAESLQEGRVVGKSIVPQGKKNAYAVVIPDTSTDPTTRLAAHVQVRKATWEALDLPRTVRHMPDDLPVDTRTAPAIGHFTMKSTRDGSGHERDGQEVVAANVLDSDLMEVQFRDGEWMLCDRDELDQPAGS